MKRYTEIALFLGTACLGRARVLLGRCLLATNPPSSSTCLRCPHLPMSYNARPIGLGSDDLRDVRAEDFTVFDVDLDIPGPVIC